jgi:glucoamylase
MNDFEAWLDAQAAASAAGLAACISATHLTKNRSDFAQVITPVPGSVIASSVTETGLGEPDYFFHWMRDSALAMDVVWRLAEQGEQTAPWCQHFQDFVKFSLSLGSIDGAEFVRTHDYRTGVAASVVQFLRPEAELSAISADKVAGDVRVNPDGTIDVIKWSRPQHDGPALRAIACLGARRAGYSDETTDQLIRQDLAYTVLHSYDPSYDIWEERSGEHYYTRLVQLGALRAAETVTEFASPMIEAAIEHLESRLALFWSEQDGAYLCSLALGGKTLDMANILGVLHANLPDGAHSIHDPRVFATLQALEAQAAEDYPINRNRAPGLGLALGRFRGDVYGTAGPWYLTSFAAAEFRYRLAAADPDRATALIDAADAILVMARATIPANGALSEQFDPTDGHQSSARDLGWSHGAFLTAYAARALAVRR